MHLERKQPRRTWHGFQVINPSSAILRGSCSINDKNFKFGSRGWQSSATSIVAILFSHLIDIKTWTSNHVDQILQHGDNLFRLSQTKNRLKPGTYLNPTQVYPEFFINDYKCITCTQSSGISGNIFTETVGCPKLTDGLENFFKLSDAGVITVQGSSVAVWRYQNTNFIYFDPSPCSTTGTKSPDTLGTACAMRFTCLPDMAQHFLGNCNRKFDLRYIIDKVDVRKITLINRSAGFNGQFQDKTVMQSINSVDAEEKISCSESKSKKVQKHSDNFVTKEPLTVTISNYNIDTKFAIEPLVNQGDFDTGYSYYDMEVNIPTTFKNLPGNVSSILHGFTHESSDIYKNKGAQTVANCIMAIAMKKIEPVKTWLRPKIDEILTLGDALYSQIKIEKPSLKSLTAADFDDMKITINNRVLFVDVDLLTVVGTLSSKFPTVLNLKQALEEFFLVNSDGIVECSSMAFAVWSQDGDFYLFNSRQCDQNGGRVLGEKGRARGKGRKKDGDTVVRTEGKSCVIRFQDLDLLCVQMLNSVDPSRKNDRFIIRHITISDNVPGTRAWSDFQPGEEGRTWILQGNISNESDELGDESRGMQGLAMPVAALVKALEVPPNSWSRETVDDVIREGDEYYNWCIPPEEDLETELTLRNLKNHLYIKDRKIKIKIEESTILGSLSAAGESKLSNLAKGLSSFFAENQFGILEIKDLVLPIWKFDEEQKSKAKTLKESTKETSYYYLDPNPRGKLGERDPEGEEEPVACVLRALEPFELARRIEMAVNPEAGETDEFFIHQFKVESIGEAMTAEEIELDKQTPIKPDLNAYSEIEGGACLNGTFNQQNSLQFKPRTRDKQQAANALVTLAMSKLYNPHLWYREVLDDILKLGDKITQENMINIPEEDEENEEISPTLRDFLMPSEIEDTFDIGVNRVMVTIDEGLSSVNASELLTSLTEFFSEHLMGVVRQDDVMLSVWKEGNIFFMLDPRGRDIRGNSKEDGFATALWFTGIDGLVENILKSIRKPEENVTIDGVTLEHEYVTRVAESERVKKTESTEDLWHHFPKKSDGIWECLGNISVMDDRFPEENRGNQTAAIALMAVVFSKVYEPRFWTSEILDEVVITGDKLHSKSVERLGTTDALRVNQIITEFFLSNRRVDLTIKDCVQAGYIDNKGTNVSNLVVGLENFFRDYNSGVITLEKNVNLAVWKFRDHYYCLIPQADGGNEESSSKPSVFRFRTVELLARHLEALVNSAGDYEIHTVDVINWNKLPPWKYDPSPAIRPSNLPPLNAYKSLPGVARAILRAGIHQGSSIFPEAMRNRQTAANCLLALAMSVIKNPVTWTKKTLDDVLVMGSNVHRESLKLPAYRETLRPSDAVRIFRVGVNVLTSDVEQSTVSGQVAMPPPEPEVKGKKSKKAKRPLKAKGKKKKQKKEAAPPVVPILLLEGVEKFFRDNRAGVLVIGRFMVAVWKDQGIFFLFDPRARSDQGLRDDHGTACTMWFGSVEPFYDAVYSSLDETEKYSRYDIGRVIVRTAILEALPRPSGFQPLLDCAEPPIAGVTMRETVTVKVETVTEFRFVDEDLSVLSGTLHMGDLKFNVKSRGLQSTAIAAVAIVVSVLHVPSTWTPNLIDAVVKIGDVLHRDSVRAARTGDRTLSMSELLRVFLVGDFKAVISVHCHTNAGILLVADLAQSFRGFFRNNCAGILHTANIAVAVMQHYGKFFLFDPRQCDETGRTGFDGFASVFKCKNIDRLASIFVDNCGYKVPCVYTLNAINVLDLQFFSDSQSVFERVRC